MYRVRSVSPAVVNRHVVDDAVDDLRRDVLRALPGPCHQPHPVTGQLAETVPGEGEYRVCYRAVYPSAECGRGGDMVTPSLPQCECSVLHEGVFCMTAAGLLQLAAPAPATAANTPPPPPKPVPPPLANTAFALSISTPRRRLTRLPLHPSLGTPLPSLLPVLHPACAPPLPAAAAEGRRADRRPRLSRLPGLRSHRATREGG